VKSTKETQKNHCSLLLLLPSYFAQQHLNPTKKNKRLNKKGSIPVVSEKLMWIMLISSGAKLTDSLLSLSLSLSLSLCVLGIFEFTK
jgi:hypothetical protein